MPVWQIVKFRLYERGCVIVCHRLTSFGSFLLNEAAIPCSGLVRDLFESASGIPEAVPKKRRRKGEENPAEDKSIDADEGCIAQVRRR